MRKIAGLVVLFALAGCSGGSSNLINPVGPGTPSPTAKPVVQSGLITPQFIFIFPAGTSTGRTPQRISLATLSVKVTFTNPPAGLSPTQTITAINPASCPCTVSGPPSPPGRSDSY